MGGNRFRKCEERYGTWTGPAPRDSSSFRTSSPFSSAGVVRRATAWAAAVPAPSPIAMAVAVTRVDVIADAVAEWHRPATRRLETFFGTSER